MDTNDIADHSSILLDFLSEVQNTLDERGHLNGASRHFLDQFKIVRGFANVQAVAEFFRVSSLDTAFLRDSQINLAAYREILGAMKDSEVSLIMHEHIRVHGPFSSSEDSDQFRGLLEYHARQAYGPLEIQTDALLLGIGGQILMRDLMGVFNGQCFPAGTLITMANGSKQRIDDIRVGDTVLSFDPATGAHLPRAVTKLYRGETEVWVNLTYTQNGVEKSLSTTPEHPFLTPVGSFAPMPRLTPAHRLAA